MEAEAMSGRIVHAAHRRHRHHGSRLRSMGIDRSSRRWWRPERRRVVVRYRQAKGLTLRQLERILDDEPVLALHPSTRHRILARAGAVLYPPHLAHCLVCGGRFDGKKALEMHLVAACHWLSDEQGRKWV